MSPTGGRCSGDTMVVITANPLDFRFYQQQKQNKMDSVVLSPPASKDIIKISPEQMEGC